MAQLVRGGGLQIQIGRGGECAVEDQQCVHDLLGGGILDGDPDAGDRFRIQPQGFEDPAGFVEHDLVDLVADDPEVDAQIVLVEIGDVGVDEQLASEAQGGGHVVPGVERVGDEWQSVAAGQRAGVEDEIDGRVRPPDDPGTVIGTGHPALVHVCVDGAGPQRDQQKEEPAGEGARVHWATSPMAF